MIKIILPFKRVIKRNHSSFKTRKEQILKRGLLSRDQLKKMTMYKLNILLAAIH